MMSKIPLLTLSFITAISFSGAAHARDTNLMLVRLFGDFDGARFQLDITGPSDKNPDPLAARRLILKCIRSCRKNEVFVDETWDTPIGAFRLWDGSSQFITIWAGGAYYRVRIYDVSHNTINKIFEEATKSAPQFVTTKDGRSAIIIDHIDQLGELEKILWAWNDFKYQIEKLE